MLRKQVLNNILGIFTEIVFAVSVMAIFFAIGWLVTLI